MEISATLTQSKEAIAVKVTILAVVVWAITTVIYRFLSPSLFVGEDTAAIQKLAHDLPLLYLLILLILGHAVSRLATMVFWKNILLSVFLTSVIALSYCYVWPKI